MISKIKNLFRKKKTDKDTGLDKSKHRAHTTKYEDLCQ